ncbi:hypothetical protein TEQG_00069 [Trichophyton equinum CBS 127.97]|uniref:Uncharacterized protein n=1 Tax=Trichophyton equinum (strain ATCC MYA-4606 / CBS 127.97) TaxID=559882 RepID=F2PGJ7_TRIEC|nr:hypothetical protein TEQG_00069 [Trichophyton equinum CBS 127.97]
MVAVARPRPVRNAAKQSHTRSQSRTRNHMSPEYSVQAASRTEKTHGNEFELIGAVQLGRRGCQNRQVDTNPMAFNRSDLGVENCAKKGREINIFCFGHIDQSAGS